MSAFPAAAGTAPFRIATCPEVLGAIARITTADSAEKMRQRLTESLANVFPISSIRFLSPGVGDRLNQTLSCEIRGAPASPRLQWDHEPRRNIAATGALGRCLRERRHVYPDGSQHMDYFPIIAGRHVIEIMEIRQQVREHAERVMFGHVMQIYSNFIRVLYEREVDELTSVYNRGAFDSQLSLTAQSLSKAPPPTPGTPQWWLLMLDVDHFKPINDRFGHLVGDEVLLLIARLFKDGFRGVDKIYRYGGEEFAVLLSPCTAHNALKSAERVRRKIEQAQFPQVGQITISGGLAPVRFDHIANIVGRADQALYQAKRDGRNRICVYSGRNGAGTRPGLQSVRSLEIFS